jgi:DNA-binding HxlR family transcriptional regulator
MDLRRSAGSPPQTTMRGHLHALTEAGLLERRRETKFPGSVDYELLQPGRHLLGVATVAQRWLSNSPEGPLQIGTPGAKSTIKALVDGWSAGVVRALAAKPLSLTELSSIITGLSYPSLERRLGAMRLAGQIERCPGDGRGTPYRVTDWMRHAIAPLAAAARWERQHLACQTAPITKIDVESAFLLPLPLIELPAEPAGICRLAVESQNGDGRRRLAGVTVGVEDGRVASCVARFEGVTGTSASGTAAAWLRAVIEADINQLEIAGDCDLARSLLDGLHATFFPNVSRSVTADARH